MAATGVVNIQLAGRLHLDSTDPGAVTSIAVIHGLTPSVSAPDDGWTTVTVPFNFRDAVEAAPLLKDLIEATVVEIFARFDGRLVVSVHGAADLGEITKRATKHGLASNVLGIARNERPKIEITIRDDAGKLGEMVAELTPLLG